MRKKHSLMLILFGFIVFAFVMSLFNVGTPAYAISSGDGEANYNVAEKTLTLKTGKVKRVVKFDGGKFVTTSLVDLKSGVSYVTEDNPQNEFSFEIDKITYRSDDTTNGEWSYVDSSNELLSQGEIQCTVTVTNGTFNVKKYYVVYPETSIIQEWCEITNNGSKVTISNPDLFSKNLKIRENNSDFYYMTGNGNYSGSSMLKKVDLKNSYSRFFHSENDPKEVEEVHGFYSTDIANTYMGVGIYNLFFATHDRVNGNGTFVLFDYIGVWTNRVVFENGIINYDARVVMEGKAFDKGETITTPKSLIGFFNGDIDDMGNDINEYQAIYKWDYTRDEDWTSRHAQWIHGRQTENAFEMAQNGRRIGLDSVWIDDSWFDAAADWNEAVDDDFAAINEFIKKSGPGMTVWSPIWQTYYKSDVALAHPEWVVENWDCGGWIGSNGGYGSHLNFAREDVYQWALQKLTSMQEKWGTYMWRYDAEPVSFSDKHNDMLAQNNNYYRLLKEFKDLNPEAAIHGCSSGGHGMTIESVRYSDYQQTTDGGSSGISTYYLSLLFPSCKIHGTTNATGLWRRAEIVNVYGEPVFSSFTHVPDAGSTEEALDIAMEINEMREYLKFKGVHGRWSKYYRPLGTDGIGAEYIMQQMNRDCSAGVIYITMWEEMVGKTFSIYPKGLNEDMLYTVSSWEGKVTPVTKTGAELMKEGVQINGLVPGETIFFNLEDRVGGSGDTEAPEAPTNPTIKEASYLGYNGIEINWTEAVDNVMVSYYNIYRNGEHVDKVAAGTFYFALSGNLYDNWEISAVDPCGNESGRVSISGKGSPDENSFNYTWDFAPEGNRGWRAYVLSSGVEKELTWYKSANHLRGNGTILRNNTMILGNAQTVIEWTASKTGYVNIFGYINKFRGLLNGNGVSLIIKLNGSDIFVGDLAGDNYKGITYSSETYVNKGDVIMFVFDPRVDNENDKIFYSIDVKYSLEEDTTPIEELRVTSEEILIAIDQSETLPIKLYPTSASRSSLRYEVIEGKDFVSVTNDGRVTGVKEGSAVVKITSTDNVDLCATVKVNVYNNVSSFNSSRDFAPIQGYRNWHYVYIPNGQTETVYEMVWDNANMRWGGNEGWIIASSTSLHPGAQSASAYLFKAPYDGVVDVWATVQKANGGGNGVLAGIYLNSSLLTSHRLGTVNPHTLRLENLELKKGDELLFVIDSIDGNNGYDNTYIECDVKYKNSENAQIVNEIKLDTSTGAKVIGIGEAVDLVSRITPNIDVGVRYTITSGGEHVIFDEENLRITGLTPGVVTITAMSMDTLTKLDTISVEVVAEEYKKVYDSISGFTTEQGKNNWYYCYTSDHSSYTQLTNVVDGVWQGHAWIRIDDNSMHPQQGYDVVRAFMAPEKGEILLFGTVKKTAASIGGNGVTASIYVNDTLVYTTPIEPADIVGVNYSLTVSVNAGDMIYLSLGSNGNDNYDLTSWVHLNTYLSAGDVSDDVIRFNENIANLPNVNMISADDKSLVDTLYNTYCAMSDEEKGQVVGYIKLRLLKEKLDEEAEDMDFAYEVEGLLARATEKKDIEILGYAISLYDSLNEKQKSVISSYDDAYELYLSNKNLKIAEKVALRIKAYDSEKISLLDKKEIFALCDMLSGLSDDVLSYIPKDLITKLNSMKEKITLLENKKVAMELSIMIEKLNEDNMDLALLNEAIELFGSMNTEQLSYVNSSRIAKLERYKSIFIDTEK